MESLGASFLMTTESAVCLGHIDRSQEFEAISHLNDPFKIIVAGGLVELICGGIIHEV